MKAVVDTVIEALSREHGLSPSHEGRHGSFIVESLSEYNLEWLRAASDGACAAVTARKPLRRTSLTTLQP